MRRPASYDPKADPLAQRAHDVYVQIIEHLPECARCKRLKFVQVNKTVAFAAGPPGLSNDEAVKLLCPPAQALMRAYNAAMSVWLESLAD